MNQSSVIDFFTKGCAESNSLGWVAARFCSQEEQIMTLQRLCMLAGMGNASVLDVGCGQGDLYGLLIEAGYKGQYTGIDITPAMIEYAKNKHPSGNFHVADIFNLPEQLNKIYDYVIAAGCFNVKFCEGQKDFVFKAMKILFDLSSKAANMSLLSYHGYEIAKQFDCLVCYEPWEIMKQALTITPSVVVDHQSLPAEFVVTLYH